jgi:hypothetical protein
VKETELQEFLRIATIYGCVVDSRFFVKQFSNVEILSWCFISKNIKSLSLLYPLRHINSLFYDKSLVIKVINVFPTILICRWTKFTVPDEVKILNLSSY